MNTQIPLLNMLFDIIVPPLCVICRSICPDFMCRQCIMTFKRSNPSIILNPSEHVDALYSLYNYKQTNVKQAIHYYKYKQIKKLAKPFGDLLSDFLVDNLSNITNNSFKNSIITYVPLHRKKQRLRGYNQSKLLATYISKNLNMPLYNGLKRIKNTQAQMSIQGLDSRKMNILDAFQIESSPELHTEQIIIIDDVATTLSTVNECARLLKTLDFKRVIACVIAH